MDLLDRLIEGQTFKEIAAAWGRSATVVYRNADDAKRRLQALTLHQAVAIWVKLNCSPSSGGLHGEMTASGGGSKKATYDEQEAGGDA